MKTKHLFFLCMISIMPALLLGSLGNAETNEPKTRMTIKTNSQAALMSWLTLSDGKTEAKEKNMPILVDFFSGEGCVRCVALEKEVYIDPQLTKAINKNFVPVRVYKNNQMTIDEQALMDKLESGGECILAFLNSKGEIIRDQNGDQISTMEMIPPDEYTKYMDKALRYNN